MGTIYNSEGIDEAKKSPCDFPSIFLRIWNVSVVWQREQHYIRGGQCSLSRGYPIAVESLPRLPHTSAATCCA